MKKLKLRVKLETERTDKYPYLRFYRTNELITRVDRYSIIMHFNDFDENGNVYARSELLFYPSDFGMNLIEEAQHDPYDILNPRMQFLARKVELLKRFGDCWWRHDSDHVLTNDNWLENQGFHKNKLQKNKLKCNNGRIRLKCKDTN